MPDVPCRVEFRIETEAATRATDHAVRNLNFYVYGNSGLPQRPRHHPQDRCARQDRATQDRWRTRAACAAARGLSLIHI